MSCYTATAKQVAPIFIDRGAPVQYCPCRRAGNRMADIEDMPWKDDVVSYIGCNFAYADLANNLPRFLTIDGKLHAETLVAASGAIAGFVKS